jgi:hypothetical protein
MKHRYLAGCLTCLWISTASAQPPPEDMGDDVSPPGLSGGSSAAAVGDPDSFGRAVKWRGGFVQDAGIVLRKDCSVAPDAERCVQLLPAPASTAFEEDDLDTIVLPANSASARSLLCQVVSPYIHYAIFNPDSQVASQAHVYAAATLRVESSVLADPNLINPITGQPFGGFIEETLPGAHSLDRMLSPLQSETASDRDRSRFCVGGIVSKDRLMDYYGLSAAQATAFFASAVTLRLGIRGSARLLADEGQFRFNVRFLSD